MNGSFLFSASKSEEARLVMSNCCGAVSTGNVGTIRSAVENILERSLVLEEIVRHILNCNESYDVVVWCRCFEMKIMT